MLFLGPDAHLQAMADSTLISAILALVAVFLIHWMAALTNATMMRQDVWRKSAQHVFPMGNCFKVIGIHTCLIMAKVIYVHIWRDLAFSKNIGYSMSAAGTPGGFIVIDNPIPLTIKRALPFPASVFIDNIPLMQSDFHRLC